MAKSNWSEYTHATEDIAAPGHQAVRVIRDERERRRHGADVAKRTLATSSYDTKGRLFAHATQVSRRPEDRGMGALLAADLKQYLPIGMTFYQGWIRAWDFTQGPGVDRGFKLFRLAPAEPGTLESLLAGAGPRCSTPMSARPPLARPLALCAPSHAQRRRRLRERSPRPPRTVVKDAFDGLVFVKKLTPCESPRQAKRPARKSGTDHQYSLTGSPPPFRRARALSGRPRLVVASPGSGTGCDHGPIRAVHVHDPATSFRRSPPLRARAPRSRRLDHRA
ncbi:MAG: erythromycin esterase family protein [Polyangiaceae bacterium]